jgi:hypothetical protein
MAYVYRHIRLDKNEPFYIGIANTDIYRASTKRNRNKIWTCIANKTTFRIEILIDNLTWEDACKKEKEFIQIYGRIDLNNGCLANLTDGGEGTLGRSYCASKEHRSNLSIASFGKKMSKEAKEKMSKAKKVAVIQYSLNGDFIKEYPGLLDARKAIGAKNSTNIMRCCKGLFKQAYGYKWKYKTIEK